jgi:carbonyl reductase 1
MPELHTLVNQFEADVKSGQHMQQGWANSNYGLSKLAVIAATKIWARLFPDISVNACCPGYCKTDMTSQRGARDPAEGARNAVMPCLMDNPPSGEFFADFDVSVW